MNTENAQENVAGDVQSPGSTDKTQVMEPVAADASLQKTQVLPKVSDAMAATDAGDGAGEGEREAENPAAHKPAADVSETAPEVAEKSAQDRVQQAGAVPADSHAQQVEGPSADADAHQKEAVSPEAEAQQAETVPVEAGVQEEAEGVPVEAELQQAETAPADYQAQQAETVPIDADAPQSAGIPVGGNAQQPANGAAPKLVPTVPIDPRAQRPWPMRAAASDLSYQSWQVPMISPTGEGKPGQREIPAQSPTPHLSSLQSVSAGLAAIEQPADAASSKKSIDLPSIEEPAKAPTSKRAIDLPSVEEPADAVRAGKHASTSGSKKPIEVPSVEKPSSAPSADKPASTSVFDQPVDMSGFDKAGDFMRALDANSAGQAAGYVNAGFELPKKRKRGGLKIFAIVIGALLLLLVAAYVAGFVYFSKHFPPGTTIGEIDASLKTAEEVEAALDAKAGAYTLTMKGGDFSYSTDAASIGYAVNSPAIVQAVQADLNPTLWPLLLFQGSHDEAGKYSTTYDQDLLKADVKKAVKAYNKDAEAPVDASIEYDETSNKFEIKPEEAGTKYGVKAVQKAACAAVDAMEETVVLGDDALAKPKIKSDDERIVAAADAATAMVASSIDLKMEGYDLGHVDGDQLAEYVSINEDYEVELDEDGLWDYLNTLVSGFNTVGGERSYTREDGKEITVVGGDWGWNIDVGTLRDQVYEMVKAGESGTVEATYWQSGQVYNGPYERDWGKRYADVDLSEQHAYLYGDDGELIWESDCITGEPTPEKETPTGVWSVQAMRTDELLKTYEPGESEPHETNVSYWMPFVGNLDAFHDAWWQPGFGGTMYADGYGSHGCVNLPSDAAAELYGLLQVGDVVVVHW